MPAAASAPGVTAPGAPGAGPAPGAPPRPRPPRPSIVNTWARSPSMSELEMMAVLRPAAAERDAEHVLAIERKVPLDLDAAARPERMAFEAIVLGQLRTARGRCRR